MINTAEMRANPPMQSFLRISMGQAIDLTDLADIDNCIQKFLIHRLSGRSIEEPGSGIPAMAGYILLNAGNCSIEKIACRANMSIKTFERKFTEQVGISPKLFSRILRFNSAVALKLSDPHRSWTDIAHHCGYYDQMHFIKECKLFAGATPTRFFKHAAPGN
jgi:AraC-like DNA-binding protein